MYGFGWIFKGYTNGLNFNENYGVCIYNFSF